MWLIESGSGRRLEKKAISGIILMLLISLSLFIGVLSSANVLTAVSVGANEGDWIEYTNLIHVSSTAWRR